MIFRISTLILFLTSAITGKAQVEISIFAGPTVTSAHYIVKETIQPTSYKPGFMAGAAMKVPFDNQLYFYPSAYYSLKGYKVTLNTPSFPPTELAINNNTTIHALDISPMFHIDLSKKSKHLYIRFGPSVDFAFSGRESFDTLSTTGTPGNVSRPMVFSFGDYGRITAAGNLHLGYENEIWSVFAHYAHGFGSLNNADEGPKIFHRIVGISFGWKLGGKKSAVGSRQ